MARILIIEDDSAIRKSLRVLLEASGHEVLEAAEGVRGMRLFLEEPTEMVITDILMPNREGLQVIIDVKKDYPQVKILAISGGGTIGPEKFLDMARDFGADGTLAKPFTLAEMSMAVKELLGESDV